MLHSSNRLNLIALSFCLAAPVTAAQGQAVPRTLTGVVRDTLGRPLEDAVIVLNPAGAQRATRADAAGRFRFDRVDAGRYSMRTTWIGYAPDERTIEVPPAGLQVIITLTPVAFSFDSAGRPNPNAAVTVTLTSTIPDDPARQIVVERETGYVHP